MPDVLRSLLGFFLNWWGALLLSALDSSMLFFLPFGNDTLVAYLVARDPHRFWLYPLMTTVGSVLGAAGTFWIGRTVGQKGLERLASKRHLERVQRRVAKGGALAMAIPAILPPPFPLTPFLLVCGALDVDRLRFFTVFAGSRLVRFGAEAALVRQFGSGVLAVMRSDTFQWAVAALALAAVVGTVVSGVALWRRTRAAR